MRSLFGLLLLTPTLLLGQPRSSGAQAPDQASERAALRFARAFYAWYVPTQARAHERGVELVLKGRPSALGRALRRALEQDSLAQSRAPEEMDGLDFDPFLNSQDPCERYEVRRATSRGALVWADVYGTCHPGRSARPAAVLELARQDTSWVIQNVRYSAHRDLLGQLRILHCAPTRQP